MYAKVYGIYPVRWCQNWRVFCENEITPLFGIFQGNSFRTFYRIRAKKGMRFKFVSLLFAMGFNLFSNRNKADFRGNAMTRKSRLMKKVSVFLRRISRYYGNDTLSSGFFDMRFCVHIVQCVGWWSFLIRTQFLRTNKITTTTLWFRIEIIL